MCVCDSPFSTLLSALPAKVMRCLIESMCEKSRSLSGEFTAWAYYVWHDTRRTQTSKGEEEGSVTQRRLQKNLTNFLLSAVIFHGNNLSFKSIHNYNNCLQHPDCFFKLLFFEDQILSFIRKTRKYFHMRSFNV